MEVIATKRFRKDLLVCPKYIQQKTGDVISILEKAQNLFESGLDYKKMQAQKGNYYRIRVGNWRIGVELKMPSIIVITILMRGEIYKQFPPE